jgi:GWxTD domain-containing protein
MERNSAFICLVVASLVGALFLGGCISSRSGAHETQARMISIPSADEVGDPAAVEATLRQGIEEASTAGEMAVAPRVFDTYVVSALPEIDNDTLVWPAFRQMLGSAASYRDDTSRAHLRQHLALSELLYADARAPADAEIASRAIQALEWWSQEQPAPATDEHERLATHLGRWAEARQKYPSRVSETGLDARGDTFVKYGAPTRVRAVNFADADLLRSYLRDGLPIRTSDFPDNEIWIYDHLGRSGVFLFVEGNTGEGYGLGSVNDLMPRQLRNRGVTGSARADVYASAALRTLRFAFSQLALYHTAYSSRFDTVSDQVNWQEERATINRLGGRHHGTVVGFDAPARLLENALSRNDREDRNLIARRTATLPSEYADVDRGQVAVAMRIIRRMEPDGRTRLHIFWRSDRDSYATCIRGSGEVPDDGRLRLVATGPGHRSQSIISDQSVGGLPWQSVVRDTVFLDETAVDLALQYDGLGEFSAVCSGVARWGELPLLDVRAEGVELSDLLPFELEDLLATRARLSTERFSDADFQPIVSNSLGSEEGLGVYFEVYTATDLDDAFILEYEINKTMPGGILRRSRSSQSIYQARQTAIDQRLSAAFLVDRAEWAEARDVEVVVRITNLETGGTAERTLKLAVTDVGG